MTKFDGKPGQSAKSSSQSLNHPPPPGKPTPPLKETDDRATEPPKDQTSASTVSVPADLSPDGQEVSVESGTALKEPREAGEETKEEKKRLSLPGSVKDEGQTEGEDDRTVDGKKEKIGKCQRAFSSECGKSAKSTDGKQSCEGEKGKPPHSSDPEDPLSTEPFEFKGPTKPGKPSSKPAPTKLYTFSPSSLPFSGLPNGYLNCYFNATLQCLFATPEFIEVLEQYNTPLAKKVLSLHTHRPSALSTEYWRDSRIGTLENIGREVMPGFGGQQCSHVLYLNLLNALSDEIEAEGREKKPFRRVFGVDVDFHIECENGHRVNTSKNRYISMSLPIPPPKNPSCSQSYSGSSSVFRYSYPFSYSYISPPQESLCISSCFALYSKPKPLDYPCKQCPITSSRHIPDIQVLPPILVLHFQRYIDGRKDDRIITFEEYITITEKAELYEVYGVVYHSGSLYGGHYYAHVKVNERWYSANDSYVQEIGDGLKAEGAYLLFCRKVQT